jgi:hypothetical protein
MSCFSEWMTRKKDDCPVCRRVVTCIMKNHPMDAIIEAFLEACPERKRPSADLLDMDRRDQLRLSIGGKVVRDTCFVDTSTSTTAATNNATPPEPPTLAPIAAATPAATPAARRTAATLAPTPPSRTTVATTGGATAAGASTGNTSAGATTSTSTGTTAARVAAAGSQVCAIQ